MPHKFTVEEVELMNSGDKRANDKKLATMGKKQDTWKNYPMYDDYKDYITAKESLKLLVHSVPYYIIVQVYNTL